VRVTCSEPDWATGAVRQADVAGRPVEPMPESLMPFDAPLNGLGQALVGVCSPSARGMGVSVPAVLPDATITGAEAIAMGHDVLVDLFSTVRS
jgi:hypothetical protein